jgi:hypothetical protein
MKSFWNTTLRTTGFAVLLLGTCIAKAEPYLAVREGFKCVQCHVNPTGGGLRNTFGNAYAQSQLAATRVDTGDTVWTGMIGTMLALGGNVRANANVVDVPHQAQTREFELDQARVYLNFAVIPNRLSIYFDELVAPGAASNRETYIRYQAASNDWSIKAGQMYLPFGLRLQDDSAFVRQVSAINMTVPDTGVELSWEPGNWSTQFAISNGSGGGPETDTGKQFSLQGSYVRRTWRIGLAGNLNNSDAGDRSVVGVFGGLTTGPIAWLAEADYVTDKGVASGTRKSIAGLLEGNWLMRKGHNLKITAEELDPDRDVGEDNQTRYSAVYEYTPIQYLQLRSGIRYYDGIPQNDLQNRRVGFVELHGFF